MRPTKTPTPYVPDQRKEMPGLVLAALCRLEQDEPSAWWNGDQIAEAVRQIRQIPHEVFATILQQQRQNTWSRGMQHAKSMWALVGLVERQGDQRLYRLTEQGKITCHDLALRASSPQVVRDMFLNYGYQTRRMYDPRFR